MYLDLSVVPANLLDLNHLLRGLQESAIGAVAIDYEYCDVAIAPLPDSFAKLQVSGVGLSKAIRRLRCTVGRRWSSSRPPRCTS